LIQLLDRDFQNNVVITYVGFIQIYSSTHETSCKTFLLKTFIIYLLTKKSKIWNNFSWYFEAQIVGNAVSEGIRWKKGWGRGSPSTPLGEFVPSALAQRLWRWFCVPVITFLFIIIVCAYLFCRYQVTVLKYYVICLNTTETANETV